VVALAGGERRGLPRRALALDKAPALITRALRQIVVAALLGPLVFGLIAPESQERIVNKRDADRIFKLNRSQWETEAARLVNSEGWTVHPGAGETGTGVMALDPKSGVGLTVQPSFRDAQGPPETLVVGSYYPPGTFRRFSEQTRRELEAAASSDLGPGYALSVSFSIMASPPPGFDVVEVIITRARR
jgi:hypothetical protein